ncbi:hypothetical protein EG329_007693 [Mollisiaceae sp. DMI_Dod_QoI]|nr:hypothetical protein EG329_007693 [Helotiales sp. DMI_Dod_QoI]
MNDIDDLYERWGRGEVDFAGLGLPVPSTPTPTEVRKEARERSTEVISRWSELRQILDRHEEMLRKRWLKKTKSQRTAILLQAWPKMASVHRPDYDAFLREDALSEPNRIKFREAYIWPYINIEDLSKGKTLLLFLNSRGRYSPRMFAHADFEAMRLGHVSGAVIPVFLNLYTMFLDGETIETYGHLVAWEDDDEAFASSTTGLGHLPGEGLLILEIQQKILRFLVECCSAILHDFNPKALMDERTIKPEPPPIMSSSEWPTSASIAAEAPYRLPAMLNFNRLRALVAANRSSAEDHIRNLREDPGYFAEVLLEWSEHRPERLPDGNGARHPRLFKPPFWDQVVRDVLIDAYGALISWDLLGSQLSHLDLLQRKYSSNLLSGQALPQEYLVSLLTFKYSLEQLQKRPIHLLQQGIPPSPAFRHLFYRHTTSPRGSLIQSKANSKKDMRTFYLFDCLWTERQLFLMGLPNIVDEIEYRIQALPTEKAMLSPWIARVFADLGLIARLQHELQLYQPWAAGFDDDFVTLKDTVEQDFSRRHALYGEIEDYLPKISFSQLGAPTEGRFDYPSDKRRTKQSTERMRKAESSLDMFWDHVDKSYQAKTKHSLNHCVQNLFDTLRQLERTPEWIEPTKETKATSAQKPSRDLYESFAPLSLDPMGPPSRYVQPELRTKLKTRGSTHESLELMEKPLLEDPLPKSDKQPVFVLKTRAYKVFKALFFNPSQSDLPGEISWTDFLFAMASTGFSPEKLYGSVWQFTPSILDVERSISFHEPHPAGKIPFRNARRMGRRLARAYGWHGGMFVLE